MTIKNFWTVPLQRACYRGVYFDVLEITDHLERSTIEQAYPFVNGADIEDLGLTPLRVQLQAMFNGSGYSVEFKRLLNALEKSGADILMHPVRGRLQNMICTSASLRHEAEYVDYVAVDLTFVQATTGKPIFVFEQSLLTKIDRLLSQLESYLEGVLELFAGYMGYIAYAQNAQSRLLSVWGGVYGVYQKISQLFSVDFNRYRLSPVINKGVFVETTRHAAGEMMEIIEVGLLRQAKQPNLTRRAGFDEVLRTVKNLLALPKNLVTGKNINPYQGFSRANKVTSQTKVAQQTLKSLTQSLTLRDVRELELLLALCCCKVLTQIATETIEQHEDELLPSDIEYIVNNTRTVIVTTLQQMRELQRTQQYERQQAGQSNHPQQPVDLYVASHQVAEKLRQHAHELSQLAMVAINRKPPLQIEPVPFDGALVQIAHVFYGDFKRADELLRLNPHICHPNFIQKGTWLNRYAK